jgi:hypothetical protein
MRRVDVRHRSNSQIADVTIAGVAWSELDIVGWEYSAGLQGTTVILDSANHSPAANDPPKTQSEGAALAVIYAPGTQAGARIENSMGAQEIRVRVYEPVIVCAEDDLLIVASQSVGMQRHVVVKRAEGEAGSMRLACSIADPEAAALAGGAMFARYVPGVEGGASIQVGGEWPEIRTLDGETVHAHSYLQIPVHGDVATSEVQVLLDNVGNAKDAIAMALIGIAACNEWQGKSIDEIEQLMRNALAHLQGNSSCRIIEAVITTRDDRLIRVDRPPAS